MAYCNEAFIELQGAYLFAEIRNRIDAYKKLHSNTNIISLGIGDVTQPLAPVVIKAMQKAVFEMGNIETFRGYGPEQGYSFLREAIVNGDFKSRGIDLEPSEIFVSDGAKCDVGNMQDIFAESSLVAVTDPVYPVYVDSNVMAGRGGKFVNGNYQRIIYMPCYEECAFKPSLPIHDPQIIYLCSPNNPTGSVFTHKDLTMWVKYAQQTGSVIFFDAAYEAFITDKDLPHSIYEIEGAKEVAIEFRSYSKSAGFTGVRCGYWVVPHALMLETQSGEKISANELWNRRQCTKFNGCSYIVQRGAEALYTEEGKAQVQATINIYRENAHMILEGLMEVGLTSSGGKNSPYIWVTVPEGMTSWEFFDLLLQQAGVVCTPGAGFGPCGAGYIRLTAFNTPENTQEAVQRLKKLLKKGES